MTRALLPALRPPVRVRDRRARAHIVNVTSVAGTVAFAPSGAYAAAKHAQLAFSRSLQASLRGSGIAVHTILPGYVQTEGFPQDSLLEDRRLRHVVVQPERVAQTIVRRLGRGSREVVVPWFPYRPATLLFGAAPALVSLLGSRVVARSPAFQAKTAEPAPESS